MSVRRRETAGSMAALALLAAGLFACGPASDDEDADFVLRGLHTCDIVAVVEYLNGGVSLETLERSIEGGVEGGVEGVNSGAAGRIVEHRDGPDGTFGTADDDLFDHIEELDDLPFVGRNTLTQIVSQLPSTRCDRDATVRCDEAPEVGTAGALHQEALPIVWRVDGERSVADPVTLRLADDTVGLALTLEAGNVRTSLRVEIDGLPVVDVEVTDPDDFGDIYPRKFFPRIAAAVVFPAGQGALDAPTGCLTIWPLAQGTGLPDGTLYVASRRDPQVGVLRFNYVALGDYGLSDEEMVTVNDAVRDLLSDSSIGVGEPERHVIEDYISNHVPLEEPAFDEVLRRFVGSDPTRINLYFTGVVGDAGTLGFAGGTPGALGVHGTGASGVALSLDAHRDASGDLSIALLASTIVHEVGHQVGLFHTSERDGLNQDPIADTPECLATRDDSEDGFVDVDECREHGGDNILFWQGTLDRVPRYLSPTQIEVILASATVRQ